MMLYEMACSPLSGNIGGDEDELPVDAYAPGDRKASVILVFAGYRRESVAAAKVVVEDVFADADVDVDDGCCCY